MGLNYRSGLAPPEIMPSRQKDLAIEEIGEILMSQNIMGFPNNPS